MASFREDVRRNPENQVLLARIVGVNHLDQEVVDDLVAQEQAEHRKGGVDGKDRVVGIEDVDDTVVLHLRGITAHAKGRLLGDLEKRLVGGELGLVLEVIGEDEVGVFLVEGRGREALDVLVQVRGTRRGFRVLEAGTHGLGVDVAGLAVVGTRAVLRVVPSGSQGLGSSFASVTRTGIFVPSGLPTEVVEVAAEARVPSDLEGSREVRLLEFGGGRVGTTTRHDAGSGWNGVWM